MRNLFFKLARILHLFPLSLTPSQVRVAYNLPSVGGSGATIAIITAYNASTVKEDLTIFSTQFNLPLPSDENFEIHKMAANLASNSNWTIETALDVEWAHAIAPQAKILLIQAKSPVLSDLLAAVDYARSRSDVTSISMSWGSDEFSTQTRNNYHFTSSYGASFFAASGDDGAGVMWPASSSNVVAVGGTTLTLNSGGSILSETAWSGSGGGVSSYEPRPNYQTIYGITTSKRAVPDVSYNANPSTGFSVYTTDKGWFMVGGTRAGAPQWAAIQALGLSSTNTNFYQQAKSLAYASYFRDITSGSNGYYASIGYDYVTGLGSPVTTNFALSSQPSVVNTSITLVPAQQTNALSENNTFNIIYSYGGIQQ